MPAPLYRVDHFRLTLRECWYQTRSAAVIVLWFLKLFRIRMPVPPMPYPESVHQSALPPDSIPEAARTRLAPLVAELEAEGFHSPRYYRYASSRSQTELYLAALLHPAGESIARAMYVVSHQTQPPTEKTRVFLLSALANDTWFVTSPLRPEFNPNPGVDVQRVLDAPPAQLARAHTGALQSHDSARSVVPVTTVEQAESLSDRYERHCFDSGIRRGLYVPLNEAEATDEQAAVVATEKAGTEVGGENAAILVEMDRLQNPKSSLKNILWILGGSLLAFVVLGGARWDLEFLAIIVPILLVHEAGHWVAMRIFGYRNLRMLFIPLFGAAVSGQNFNVPGWKKALVSLAGPGPGILIGTAIALLALWVDQPWVEKLALMTIVLNAINLLPFVPLDGGWFLNATVFCRRAWMETGFKVLAITSLFAAGVTTGDSLWTGLAILMAMSISRTWRLGRLAERLRADGVSAQSLDRQTIPPETAAQLITAVNGSTTKARSIKLVAGEVLDLFERLNARPPGILATLSLLAVYLVTLGIAFLGLGVAELARNGDLGLLDASESEAPALKRALECGGARIHTGTGPWPSPTNRVHLAGIHPDSQTAAAAWASITNAHPARVVQMGPLVVALKHDLRDPAETKNGPPFSPGRYHRLGVVSAEAIVSSNSQGALAATGTVRMKDGRPSIHYLTFREPTVGLAALVDWLCASGATDLRMAVSLVPAEPDEAPAAP